MPFVKLDTGILDSSLWSEPAQICKCWITLLAMADPEGFVNSTAPGISRRANIGLAEAEKALELFAAPDEHSRSLLEDGKRLLRVEGGFKILNYDKYRERDYTAAERQKRWRDKQKRNAVTSRRVTQADAEYRVPKHLNDVLVYAQNINLPASEAEKFFDHFTSNGWRVGGRTAMKDWKAALRNWTRKYINMQSPFFKPKEKAPIYPKLPPKREITDEELAAQQRIVREASAQLKKSLQPF
jgi:hypothetical protein